MIPSKYCVLCLPIGLELYQLGVHNWAEKKHFIERRRRQIILHDSVFPPIPFNPITAMTDLDRNHFCRILPFFPKQFFVQLLPSIQISFLLFLSRRFQSLFSESRHLLLPPFVCPKDLWFIFCFCALPFRQTTRLLQCCKQHPFWRARVSSCVYARAGRSLFVKKPYGGLSDHLPSTIFVSTKVRSFWEMAFQTTVKYRPR